MARKTFEIDFNGKKETIEYEDDIPFGDMEQIIKNSIDLRDLTKPKINVSEYRLQVTLAALTKAPFDIKSPKGLKELGQKTAKKVVSGVTKDYPLVYFLEDWMTSLMGSLGETKQSLQSMATVQQDSDGPKTKQTNTEQNS